MQKQLCLLTFLSCIAFPAYPDNVTYVDLIGGLRGEIVEGVMVEAGIAASHQVKMPFGFYYGVTAAIAGNYINISVGPDYSFEDGNPSHWELVFVPRVSLGIAYSVPITPHIGFTAALFEITGIYLWLSEYERQSDNYLNSVWLGVGGILKFRFRVAENLELYAALQPGLEAVTINTAGAYWFANDMPYSIFFSCGVAF